MTLLGLRMSRRFERGGTMRLLLSRIALACGVALVCAIELVNHAVSRAFVEVIDTMAGRTALEVSAIGGGLSSERVADTIAGLPGVELARCGSRGMRTLHARVPRAKT